MSPSQLWAVHRRLIQGFYWCFVIKTVTLLLMSSRFVELSNPVYLWPVRVWAEHLSYQTALTLISGISLFFSVIVAIGYYQRWLRVLQFIFFFEFFALINSHGQIRHDAYPLLWIGFMVLGLNMSDSDDEFNYQSAFSIFNSAKAYLLMSYALSGFWKVRFLFQAVFITGLAQSGIDINSPMQKVAYVLARNSNHALLGVWSLGQPVLMFVLWIATLLMQLSSAPVYFFPRWHRVWGLILIAFHFSTYLFFRILFDSEAMLILLFLVLAVPALPATQPAFLNKLFVRRAPITE